VRYCTVRANYRNERGVEVLDEKRWKAIWVRVRCVYVLMAIYKQSNIYLDLIGASDFVYGFTHDVARNASSRLIGPVKWTQASTPSHLYGN
jgi:hypothetical protein